MPRRHLAASAAVLALALVTACDKKDTSASPTAPAPVAPAASLAPAVSANALAGAAQGGSSICRGYTAKKTGLAQAIAKSSANAKGLADLKAQAAALDVMIKDACDR